MTEFNDGNRNGGRWKADVGRPFHPDMTHIAYGLRGCFLGKDVGWAFVPGA